MLRKLAELPENELTQTIVIPLFEKMYGCRVVFTGGVREKGRDAIVYRRSPLDENEFIGIQVKKQKLTANSTTNSLQQLLTQLAQMSNEPAQCPDTHVDVYFTQQIFITPYEIAESAIQSHQGALQEASKVGVTVIDGKKLLLLIKRYAPELERQITGDRVYIGEKLKPALSNAALMKALAFKDVRNICDIYCETKLSIGNSSNEEIIYSDIKLNQKNSHLKVNSLYELGLLASIRDYCVKELSIDIVDSEQFTIAKTTLLEKSNLESEIKAKREMLGKHISSIRKIIENSNFSLLYPNVASWNDFSDFVLEGYLTQKTFKDSSFLVEIELIQKIIHERDIINRGLELARAKLAMYEPELNVQLRPEKLIEHYNFCLNEVDGYSGTLSDIHRIRDFLALSKTLEKLSGFVFSLREHLTFTTLKSSHNSHIKIAIEDAFKTGLNIAVLGDAGSGKTTNLQHYTLSLLEDSSSKLTLYVTLSELASKIDNGSDKETSLIDALYCYLNDLGTNNFSSVSFKTHLAKEETVLIVDSVDEAIVQYPWVIDSLRNFSDTYKNCQVITSSRFTVKDISKLGFVNISLLPFDEQQKADFFKKWFTKDSEKPKAIIEHLSKYPKLNSVVNNPLSATIMATLQESSVPLPCTEAQLYKKRFDLLSGMFDRFKGINRNSVSPQLLLNALYHMAYKLHVEKDREFTRDQAIEFLCDFPLYDIDPNVIFEELVTPCEIILSSTNRKYTFGHLRFQEYLASEQMVLIQRNIPLDKYITMPWWNDVFLLYSQHAVEIESIVNYVTSDTDLTLRAFPLIRSMISFRSSNEQAYLTKRIEIAYQNAQSEIPQNRNFTNVDDLLEHESLDLGLNDLDDINTHLDHFSLNDL